MSYPPELALVSSAMRNFLVQTVQIEPRSVRVCQPNDTLKIRLPENTLVDLASFAIRGSLIGIRPPGNNTQCVLPGLSSSLIQELSVSVNHTLVDHVRDYNHVALLYSQMQDGARAAKGDGMKWGESQGIYASSSLPRVRTRQVGAQAGLLASQVPISADSLFGSSTNALPVSFQDWVGFLGQNRWIHSGFSGPIEILVRFADKNVIMSDTTTGDASYQLQGLRAHINVATIEDGLFDELMSQRLAGGGLALPFKRYMTHRGELLRSSGSVPWSVVTKSLDMAACVLLHPNPGRQAPLDTAEPYAMESPVFRRHSRGPAGDTTRRVRSAHCTLQGVQYPGFRPDPNDWLYLANVNFRQHGNKYDGAVSSLSLSKWINEASFFSYRWSYDARQDGTSIESGLDSQNLEFHGTFEYDIENFGDDFEATPLIILETTSSLIINPYRELTLVA